MKKQKKLDKKIEEERKLKEKEIKMKADRKTLSITIVQEK